MILKIIKDLLWQDQFVETTGKRLDRDRYFIAQSLLFMMAVLVDTLVIAIGSNGIAVLSVSDLLGLLWLAAHLLLAYRTVGIWFALPLTLINLATTHLVINLLHIAAATRHASSTNVLIAEMAISVLWLILHLFWFRKLPQLAQQQPKHPLLQSNPAHQDRLQLHAVGYFWQSFRLLLWNIIPIILFILGRADGLHWDDQGITFCLGAWGVLLCFFGGRMLYRRSLNIGWHFGKTLTLLLLPLAASITLKSIIPSEINIPYEVALLLIGLQMLLSWFSIVVVALLALKTAPPK
ncbi:hypothetical protein L9G74_17425 [Shewanella sp. C32]|uniref:Uncharacterized protein n=1 Tax=Shewanella electrica TaxID=515560 RepID=A0ABT2FPF6_9GAMM|nr:hypothetical protein [Shewanella electrica]MCH1926602.1 hypothetical protein [Shewanella electrica]MCS4558223.1 hypothetical protein [Shewanella electrica]